ncbi:hypothetical protein CN481_19200 [Bacillus sp. AFS006103]|nr:hypothetical protein CN481_19200 [Bacillus sp. AFS006103]
MKPFYTLSVTKTNVKAPSRTFTIARLAAECESPKIKFEAHFVVKTSKKATKFDFWWPFLMFWSFFNIF